MHRPTVQYNPDIIRLLYSASSVYIMLKQKDLFFKRLGFRPPPSTQSRSFPPQPRFEMSEHPGTAFSRFKKQFDMVHEH